MEPLPEPVEIFLVNSRLEDIILYLLSGSHYRQAEEEMITETRRYIHLEMEIDDYWSNTDSWNEESDNTKEADESLTKEKANKSNPFRHHFILYS